MTKRPVWSLLIPKSERHKLQKHCTWRTTTLALIAIGNNNTLLRSVPSNSDRLGLRHPVPHRGLANKRPSGKRRTTLEAWNRLSQTATALQPLTDSNKIKACSLPGIVLFPGCKLRLVAHFLS